MLEKVYKKEKRNIKKYKTICNIFVRKNIMIKG